MNTPPTAANPGRAAPQREAPGPDRRFRLEWLALGLATLMLGGYVAAALDADHRRIDAEERSRLHAQAHVLDQNLGRQLLAVDRSLTSIREDLPTLKAQLNSRILIDHRLQAVREAMPGARAVSIFDAAGTLTARSPDEFVGQNFAGRDYYRIARQDGDPARLYIAPPFLAQTGDYVLNVVKVLPDDRGAFAGIVLVSLGPAYFDTLLSSVRYAPDMLSSLIHGDGKVIFRVPDTQGIVGIDLSRPGSFFTQHIQGGEPSSEFAGAVASTGEMRLTIMHSIQPAAVQIDKPLVVAVSRELSPLFAHWRRDVYERSWGGAGLLLAAAAGLFFSQRRRRAFDRSAAAMDDQRRRAEAELRVSQQRWQFALEGAGDGVWEWNARSDDMYYSPQWKAMLGYADADIGSSRDEWETRIHPQDRERARAAVERQFADAPPAYVSEYRMRCKDGSYRWIVARGQVVERDADGRPARVIGIHSDITERKRADVIVRTRLRLAELDAAGSIDELLQVALDGAEEVTGSEIGFFHFVDADQEQLTLQAWSTNTLAHMCTAEGKAQHYAIGDAGVWVDCFHARAPVIHNDYAGLAHRKGLPPGHAQVTRELVVPILRAGKVTEILGVGNKASDYLQEDVDAVYMIADLMQEVVERRRAEAALRVSEEQTRGLLAAIPDGILTHRDGRVEFVNQSLLRMFRFPGPEAVVGRSLTEFVAPAERGALALALSRAATGAATARVEVQAVRGDGSLLDVDVSAANFGASGALRVVVIRDVSARKRTEMDLRKLSRAVEQSPVSIVITDRAGRIEYVNPRFEQVTGYSRDEAVGSNPRMLKSGLVPVDAYRRLWATIADGGEWRGELCNRRKNGELFWEHAAISGLKDEAGEVSHYIAVKEDITERKAFESKILRLRDLYAALSHCNQAVVHCSSEEQLYEEICRAVVNYGGMKMAWVSQLDAAGTGITRVASYGDSTDYLADIEVSLDPDQPAGRGPTGTAIRENRPCWIQDFLNDPATQHWHERGTTAGWRASAAVPLRRNGVAVGALTIYSTELDAFDEEARGLLVEMAANIGLALDHLTQEAERRRAESLLKESEGRLSAIVQASPIGISVTSLADGRVLDVNDAALRQYGYRRDEAIGRTVVELGVYEHPAQREELVKRLREYGRIDRFPVDFRHRSGSVGAFEVSGRVIELQGERCLLAMMMDVTERRRLEQVHLQAQNLESLGTLAGGIAHDFNNILAAIRGNADLAAEDLGPDHIAAESLQEIRKASVRASELIRRIMAFGRPKAEQKAVVDLGAVVREVLKLLRSTLPAGISFDTRFASDTPHVLANAGEVHEAIVNLTTNAAYAVGHRAGSIEYRLEPVRVSEAFASGVPGLEPGRYACLTITDSGSGMDAATLARIFDAFYTTKPVGEGTGLGLSMVHGTMRSHGGAVTAESSPGKGSSFRLYFPAAGETAAREDDSVSAPRGHAAGQRVLYVDDEAALVFLADRVLSRLGHRLSGFTDPEAALETFRAHPEDFDVVVTDLAMPELSGFDLAREVLTLRTDIPVLMTTGYVSAEDEARARETGIRELILKPFAIDELGRVLDRIFGEGGGPAGGGTALPAGSAACHGRATGNGTVPHDGRQ